MKGPAGGFEFVLGFFESGKCRVAREFSPAERCYRLVDPIRSHFDGQHDLAKFTKYLLTKYLILRKVFHGANSNRLL